MLLGKHGSTDLVTADPFDIRWGTDTGGTVALRDLEIASPNARYGQACQATHQEALPEALKILDEDWRNFTLVDLGCGKGRVVLIAAMLGFRRAVGVEFAPELVQIAERNIEILSLDNAEIVCMDATEFQFPKGDLVVFLYNPFLWEVLRPVIENLRAQYSGKLYIIYRYPKCGDVITKAGFLDYIGEVPGWQGPRGIHVWKAAN